jgi:hypothetical protein
MGAGSDAVFGVGVERRAAQVSDIFGLDLCVAMQAIAHFFEKALPLGWI